MAGDAGLFVLLFGVPALLLAVVFAAVALKAPRGGAVLCGLLLASVAPLPVWRGPRRLHEGLRHLAQAVGRDRDDWPRHRTRRADPPTAQACRSKEGHLMDLKLLATVFGSVFIAELGDKTQLATLLFSADQAVSKLTVFIAASAALILATGIGVLAGGVVSQYVSPATLKYVAGAGFIAIGAWTLLRA